MKIKKISSKYLWLLVIVVVSLLVLMILTRPEPQAQLVEVRPVRVVVVDVLAQDIQPELTVTGYLQPQRQAALSFEVAGRVVERVVEPGQAVKRGEVLLRLEAADYRDAVLEAKARLAQEAGAVARDRQLLVLAQNNLELQQQEVARQQRLGAKSLASKTTLDGAQRVLLQLRSDELRLAFSVETADARLNLYKAALNRAQRNLDRTALVASFAGVVNSLAVDVGDYVGGSAKVAELVATEQLDFYTEINGQHAAALILGQAVEVSFQGQAYKGELVALQPQPDAVTSTHRLRVRLPNPGVLPGLLAQARLYLPKQSAVILVPVTALVREDGQAYAFVLEGERLLRRELTLGLRQGEAQVVLTGLSVGEQIVAQDVAALTAETLVEVVDR